MSRINPAIKFVSLLAVTLILAWKYSLILNTVVFLLCVAAILVSRVPPKKLLLLMLPVFLAALGMYVTGSRFSADGGMPVRADRFLLGDSSQQNGLTQASRVLAYAGIGYLFALTTDRVELVRSFQKQFRLPQVFAYGLLAAWGIFPQMLQEYKRTRAAFRARGCRAFPVSPAVLKPLLVKAVRWSEALSIAMESKGFSADGQRTEFKPVPVRPADWCFLIGTICGIVLCACLQS